MTRFGFLFFNILLVGSVYGLIYITGGKEAGINYALDYFSVPWLAVTVVMIILATIRWFMEHNPEVSREAVTLIYSGIITALLTFAAVNFTGNIHMTPLSRIAHMLKL